MLTENPPTQKQAVLTIDGGATTVKTVVSATRNRFRARRTDDLSVRERVSASVRSVAEAVQREEVVYGVTTGFGGMVEKCIPADLAAASQDNLLLFLAAGAGPAIERRHVRAAMLLRANVLLRGCSGVRLEVIDRLIRFLDADAIPIVRELGSIGASGDLIPLASIGRAITGQTEFANVQIGDRILPGKTALRELGLGPMQLLPKEGLAIVNGTSFSSAIAAHAVFETRQLMSLAIGAQALMMRALMVNEGPFEEFVHQCKPHPGQVWVAEVTKRFLSEGRKPTNRKPAQVQDRYSLRCLPQYMGPIVEGIARINQVVEIEMNSVSDNPLIDPTSGQFYQSGNFLGQYIGIAMDELRRHIGLMAKHLDVQIASVVTPEFSGGLPPSLRGNEAVSYNMGLKGLQITGNSIMPMLTYYGNPVVEHYPTHAEQFNQNINGLSWGSANLAWKSVNLFQQYMSVALLFAVQSLDLRAKQNLGHYDGRAELGSLAEPLYSAVYELLNCSPGENEPFLFNDADRWLESDIETLAQDISKPGLVNKAVRPLTDWFEASFLESPQ